MAIPVIVVFFSIFIAIAQNYLKTINTSNQIIPSILLEADKDIKTLKYDDAHDKVKELVQIYPSNKKLQSKLLEIAFFHFESGDISKSISIIQDIDFKGKLDSFNLEGYSFQERRNIFHKVLSDINKDTFQMVLKRYYPSLIEINGGNFVMGCDTLRNKQCGKDEFPPHNVRLDDFKMGQTEVTVWQYALFCKSVSKNIQNYSPPWGLDGHDPMVNLTWYDAIQYCNWVSSRMGFEEVYVYETSNIDSLTSLGYKLSVSIKSEADGFRLPTESEWEYAAKGGTNQSSFIFSGGDVLNKVGWYSNNSNNRVNKVSNKRPNSAALFDMSGNVFEWCQDWYDNFNVSNNENPFGPTNGDMRVLRGGSWVSLSAFCTVTSRNRNAPINKDSYTGFRVARN